MSWHFFARGSIPSTLELRMAASKAANEPVLPSPRRTNPRPSNGTTVLPFSVTDRIAVEIVELELSSGLASVIDAPLISPSNFAARSKAWRSLAAASAGKAASLAFSAAVLALAVSCKPRALRKRILSCPKSAPMSPTTTTVPSSAIDLPEASRLAIEDHDPGQAVLEEHLLELSLPDEMRHGAPATPRRTMCPRTAGLLAIVAHDLGLEFGAHGRVVYADNMFISGRKKCRQDGGHFVVGVGDPAFRVPDLDPARGPHPLEQGLVGRGRIQALIMDAAEVKVLEEVVFAVPEELVEGRCSMNRSLRSILQCHIPFSPPPSHRRGS